MSSTQLLVLGVVRKSQPMHGYDVRRTLLTRAGAAGAGIRQAATRRTERPTTPSSLLSSGA